MAALCSGTGHAQTAADEPPAVTPYRPSVSTPAALSAPGWLEIEGGALRARGSGDTRRDSLPYTLKLAFTPDWGVRLGGDAWVRQTDEVGQRISGAGDPSIVLKRRFAIDEASAFGLEAGATLPTGRRGISSGKSDYSINAIYSADLGSFHTDLNLVATRVGAVAAGASRMQTLWASSLSRSLSDRWGAVGEFSGTRQRGADGTRQFLLAASYNVSKTVTLDAGFARSLRSGVPDRFFFTGLTVLGPRLF
ncbi:MAG: transporter [Rubrivivax sp.]|nr:transporter [Rubrivivax sp.]